VSVPKRHIAWLLTGPKPLAVIVVQGRHLLCFIVASSQKRSCTVGSHFSHLYGNDVVVCCAVLERCYKMGTCILVLVFYQASYNNGVEKLRSFLHFQIGLSRDLGAPVRRDQRRQREGPWATPDDMQYDGLPFDHSRPWAPKILSPRGRASRSRLPWAHDTWAPWSWYGSFAHKPPRQIQDDPASLPGFHLAWGNIVRTRRTAWYLGSDFLHAQSTEQKI